MKNDGKMMALLDRIGSALEKLSRKADLQADEILVRATAYAVPKQVPAQPIPSADA